jgi:hypothetical protein
LFRATHHVSFSTHQTQFSKTKIKLESKIILHHNVRRPSWTV